MTDSFNHKNRQRRSQDDSVFSRNHHRNVRYRERVQQEKEAESEIKEFKKKLIEGIEFPSEE